MVIIIKVTVGLILYVETLRQKFPDSTITTYFLGSDQNEQGFAGGRRKDDLWYRTVECEE